jgi:hypothetical protein
VIKTVIFDLGKVLIPFDFSRGYRAMEKFCDYPAAEIPKRIAATDLVHRFETGLVEPRDFVEQLSRMLDLRVTYEQFCEIWSSIFLPDTLVPESLLAGHRRALPPAGALQHQRHPLRHGAPEVIPCSGTSTIWCFPTK